MTPMEAILSGIISALVAGATARVKDVASDAVKDSYEGLKGLIVRKLGKSGAVQSVEDDPASEHAQSNLAIAISKTDVGSDAAIQQMVESLTQALEADRREGRLLRTDIDITSIAAGVDANIGRLVAAGSIRIHDVKADGNVNIMDVAAGLAPPDKLHPKNV